ncbi:carbohydrate ABC transporter substrate-binding protein [Micromonospora sp. STR1s_6]|uniref:Carbohydrate ABC transporter substrate-binding protein n=1 Tax=Micromonospora tarensis TaxID=2806100 RepID=A0ABS1YB62_9ACTN|nr:carbohydrate ABC transporter substrate-binding protein [Micromonospora tarensis]
MEKLIANFNAQGKGTASLNTIASETFRTQLPTYLTSANPPDLYTWYAGSVANDYASKNLLLDVSDVWKTLGDYPQSLRTLSTDASGKQIFVPMNNYWWGFFYRKSNFAKWGVQEPKTWADFLALCETLKSKGVPPIGIGSATPRGWPRPGSTTSTSGSTARRSTASCSPASSASTTPRSRRSSPAGARSCPTSTPRARRTRSRRRPPRCWPARPACS